MKKTSKKNIVVYIQQIKMNNNLFSLAKLLGVLKRAYEPHWDMRTSDWDAVVSTNVIIHY